MLWATASTVLARRALGTLGSILIADTAKSQPDWLAPGTLSQSLFSAGSANNPVWANPHFLGTFTRNQAVATGTQTIITGFRPKFVFVFAVEDNSDEVSFGFDGGTTADHLGVANDNQASAGTWTTVAASIDMRESGAGTRYSGVVTVNNIGFVINWTKAGSPTGTTTVRYIALR